MRARAWRIALVACAIAASTAPIAVGDSRAPAAADSTCSGNGLYDQTAKRGREPERDAAGHEFPLVTVHGITGSDDDFDRTVDKSYIGARPKPDRSLLDLFAGPKARSQTVPPGLPGVHVYSFSYTPDSLRWVDHEKVGHKLAAAIDCLYAEYGVPVSVVAHSMGGLVTRWVANTPDAAGVPRATKIGKVITIGTPFEGSYLAAIGLGGQRLASLPPPLAPAVSLVSFLCGEIGTNTGRGNCGPIPFLASLNSVAGRALATGSPEIGELLRWPTGMDVTTIAGSIKVPLVLIGSGLDIPVDLGDLAVATGSATADPGLGRVFECTYDSASGSAATELKRILRLASPQERQRQLHHLIAGSPCFHSYLMRNVALTNEVLGVLSDWLLTHRAVDLGAVVGCTGSCTVTGRVDFEHPTWGSSALITMKEGGSTCARVRMAVLDQRRQVRWDRSWTCYEELAPASPSKDRTGHLFVNFNPGRYNGVIVLEPVADGLRDFGSLPGDDDGGYNTRFYYADANDTDGDGTLEILKSDNDCVPDCAGGAVTTRTYRWNGRDYAEVATPVSADCSLGALRRDLAASLGSDLGVVDGLCEGGWALIDSAASCVEACGDSWALVRVSRDQWEMFTGFPTSYCRGDLANAGVPERVLNRLVHPC